MNIPNILSLIRLCVVPLVPLVYFSDPRLPHANLWAAVIYLLASLTDVLDGFIARRYNLVTRLGRVLDPLADKLMAFCVLVCLIISTHVPFWAGVIFFVKESFMGLGALALYRKISDVPPSNALGKTSTSVFFVICFFILLFPDLLPDTARLTAISIALALNVAAFAFYIGRFVKRNKGEQ